MTHRWFSSSCKVFTFLFFVSLYASQTASAVSGCSSISSPPSGVLYKPSNVHGGRGPSLICSCGVKNSCPYGSITIVSGNGSTRGSFRMFDAGHRPYGRRFYTYGNAGQLGHSPVYLKVGRGCWKINNPFSRQGNVFITAGRGAC